MDQDNVRAARCHQGSEQIKQEVRILLQDRTHGVQMWSLKNAITELKKENAKETVAHTTSIPASEKAEEEDSYEAVYVHTTEIVQPSVRRPSTLQPWCIRVDF